MTGLREFAHQRRGLIRAAVSVAVGGVLLFFVLRAIRTADLVETLSDISPGLAVLAAIGAFAFIVARAWRYRLLLGIERSKTGTLLAITFASWGASLVLPGPSGDAAFVLLARTRLKTPVAVGAGAAVLSRLLDVASLVPISLVQVWFALSIRTLLFAVPVQGLGGLGTTQLWWTAGLTLIGWPARAALATSLAVHLVDLLVSVPQAALGWAYLQFRRPVPDDALPAAAEAQRV